MKGLPILSFFIFIFIFSGCSHTNKDLLISAKCTLSKHEKLSPIYNKETLKHLKDFKYYPTIQFVHTFTGRNFFEENQGLDENITNISNYTNILTDLKLFTHALINLLNNKNLHTEKEFYINALSLYNNKDLKKIPIEKDSEEERQLFYTSLDKSLHGYCEYVRHENLKKLIDISDTWLQVIYKPLLEYKGHLKTILKNKKAILSAITTRPNTYCLKKNATEKQKACIPIHMTLQSMLEIYKEISQLEEKIKKLNL